MSVYQQVLDIAREQSAALRRGELDAAVTLLDRREELLAGAPVPSPDEISLVEQIMHLDRDLSSAIRERMINIRNESLEAQKGRRALDGYGRPQLRRPLAIDRVS